MSQSKHKKTETTIKHSKEFQILTTERPRKKSKPKEKEMTASSSNSNKEIRKRKKEIKEEKMRLDKELKDLIEQWQKEKEKPQAIAEIRALLQDSDTEAEETRQGKNHWRKEETIKEETSEGESSKTDEDIKVEEYNRMIAAKLKAYQDLSDEEGKEQEDRRKRKKVIISEAWKTQRRNIQLTINIPRVKVIKTKEDWIPTKRNNSTKKRTTTERKDTNLQEGESKGEKSKTREEITQVLSRKAEIPEILWEEHPSHNS